jgi:hypothetical protein
MANLVPITWGLIRLWCSRIETTAGRMLTVHDLTQGNSHPVHDGGLDAKRVRLTLIFDDFPGETEAPEVRLQRIIAAHENGTEAVFSHPIHGTFLAKIGSFSHTADEHTVFQAEAEFVPVEDVQPVSPAGAGVPGIVGEASVGAAADALDGEIDLVQLGIFLDEDPLETTALARERVAAWNTGEETPPTREIIADTADVSARLSTMIEDGGLEEDLALFDVFRATVMFGESFRAAALAATSETPAVFVMRVTTPIVILRLAAEVYGGVEAEDRDRQIRALNDIRTPGWFGPGDLLMPVPGSNRRVI